MPTFRKAPFRQLTPEEVAKLYPRAAISADYGQPRPSAGPGGTPGESEGGPGAHPWGTKFARDFKNWPTRWALAREARRRQQAETRHQDEGCSGEGNDDCS